MPKSISSQKKWDIIFLHLKEEGPKLSISKIAKKLKISTYTEILDSSFPGNW
jgi:hypothetical protein